MQKVRKLLYSLLIILLISPATITAKGKWELVSRKAGVKVYKRERKNNIYEFKGTAVVNAPPLELVALFLDYPAYPKWQTEINEVTVLAKPDPKTKIVYWALDMPWPVSDRDSVVKSRVIVDSTNKWVHVKWRETNHPARPKNSDYIRVPLSRGQYSIKPIKEGKASWLEFSGYGDPGGMIPDWIIRWVSEGQIVKGVQRVRKRIKTGKSGKSALAKQIKEQYKEIATW